MEERPFVVGLTGGIGSGKSTVAGMLSAFGVPVLDLDVVGHTVLMTHDDIHKALIRTFGTEVFQENGNPDRNRIGQIALATEEGTRLLGSIVHPSIWREAEVWISSQQTPYVIIEASVLLESKGTDRVDFVVVVLADIELRRRRTVGRGKHDNDAFNRIVIRQCNDEERQLLADRIIYNNGDLDDLQKAADKLNADLTAIAEAALR